MRSGAHLCDLDPILESRELLAEKSKTSRSDQMRAAISSGSGDVGFAKLIAKYGADSHFQCLHYHAVTSTLLDAGALKEISNTGKGRFAMLRPKLTI